MTSPADALKAAERIGYPVVLKAVSAHADPQIGRRRGRAQSGDAERVAAAYERMTQTLKGHTLAGMLVVPADRGGLELVLGLHRDPEMGLVVMAGAAACCSN